MSGSLEFDNVIPQLSRWLGFEIERPPKTSTLAKCMLPKYGYSRLGIEECQRLLLSLLEIFTKTFVAEFQRVSQGRYWTFVMTSAPSLPEVFVGPRFLVNSWLGSQGYL